MKKLMKDKRKPMESLKKYLEGKTKKDFAAKIGVSPSYLSQILSGAKSPQLDLAFRIEKATSGEVPATTWLKEEKK